MGAARNFSSLGPEKQTLKNSAEQFFFRRSDSSAFSISDIIPHIPSRDKHPEMVKMEHALEETLRRPHLVIRSGMDASTNLSYRYYYGTLVGDKWLCVVVKSMVLTMPLC